jgi:hypothetical protein
MIATHLRDIRLICSQFELIQRAELNGLAFPNLGVCCSPLWGIFHFDVGNTYTLSSPLHYLL